MPEVSTSVQLHLRKVNVCPHETICVFCNIFKVVYATPAWKTVLYFHNGFDHPHVLPYVHKRALLEKHLVGCVVACMCENDIGCVSVYLFFVCVNQ
jgi:hypothetical protein